jgi:hypothetical protein
MRGVAFYALGLLVRARVTCARDVCMRVIARV